MDNKLWEIMGKVYFRLPFGNDGRGTPVHGWGLLGFAVFAFMLYKAIQTL